MIPASPESSPSGSSALFEPLDRLAGSAAGREHHVLVPEDDDGLPALLEQHPAPRGVGVHAHGVLTDA